MELFSNPADRAVVDFLFPALLKGGLLTALLLVIGRGLARASAAVRAAWCTTGALAVLSVPVLTSLLPGWSLGPLAVPEGLARPLAEGIGGGASAAGPVLLGVWAAGVAVLLARLLLQLGRIVAITDRGDDVAGAPLGSMARAIGREMGLPRRVRVVLSEAVRVPCTWGIRRPVVLLPAAAAAWPRDLQRAVLHHELAHIARGDYVGLLWLELVRVLHWPDPFAWLLRRAGRNAQEKACDDAAVRAGIPPVEYARHLLAVGRHVVAASRPPVAALPMIRTGSLRDRVASVLDPGANRRPATMTRLLLTGAVIALLAAPVAVASPHWICPGAEPPVGTAPSQPTT